MAQGHHRGRGHWGGNRRSAGGHRPGPALAPRRRSRSRRRPSSSRYPATLLSSTTSKRTTAQSCHGTISGATGEVRSLTCTLSHSRTRSRPARIGSNHASRPRRPRIRFTVTPSVATHYAVRLFPASPATVPVQQARLCRASTSPADQSTGAPPEVQPPRCADRDLPHRHVRARLGPQLFRDEQARLPVPRHQPWVVGAFPPSPNWLYLNGGHAKSRRVRRRISAGEFENTLTFSFTIGNHSYSWLPAFCTRDAVSKDGLGLPGSHDCGASRIPLTLAYLG